MRQKILSRTQWAWLIILYAAICMMIGGGIDGDGRGAVFASGIILSIILFCAWGWSVFTSKRSKLRSRKFTTIFTLGIYDLYLAINVRLKNDKTNLSSQDTTESTTAKK